MKRGQKQMYDLNMERVLRNREALQACLDRAAASGETPGISLLVTDRKGEDCFLASGYADPASRQPLARDSIFRCYSMTKPLTSCAAMLLMQEGKLDMFHPVSRYFSSFRSQRVWTPEGEVPAARENLVLDLLDMTAGLAYDGEESLPQRETAALFEEAERRLASAHPMDTQEFARRVGDIPLLFHPGSGWNYSVCADVLGAVVEKAADMPFADFIRQRILEPLGMSDSGFSLAPDRQRRLVTACQKGADGSWVPYTGNHLNIRNDGGENPFHSGGAGLFSTADDYARFGRMLLRGGVGDEGQRILSENTVRWMTGRRQAGRPQQDILQGLNMWGHTYTNLLRITVDPSAAFFPANAGEYGWGGWLGTEFFNDPATGCTILLMQNLKDGDGSLARRVRSLLYLA